MKAIIQGWRYDTETATLIGQAGYNGSRNDFEYWEAGLYVTKKGNYFVAGKGGPMSMFSKPVDSGGATGSEGIKTLSEDEALEWAERNLPIETVEQHFGGAVHDA